MANMQNIATFPLEVDVTMATGGARQGEIRLVGFRELDMVSVGEPRVYNLQFII